MIIKTCNAKKPRRQEQKKKSIGLISKNNNFARAVHFFCTFLCRCCCNVELLVARFTKKMSYIKSHDRSHYGSCVHVCTHEKKLLVFLMSLSFFLFFFFNCRSVSPYWPLTFLIFHCRYKSFMSFFQPNYFALDFCITFSC